MKFVTYYRVSTNKQGMDGLGMEAQRHDVERFLLHRYRGEAEIVAEFSEVRSGTKRRPMLDAALAETKKLGATLIVAKLDRMARNTELFLNILNSGVAVVFVDLPDVDSASPAGRMMLTVLAAAAEFEARMISTRTKAAISAAKSRGTKFGGLRPRTAESNEEKKRQAQEKAENLRALVIPLRQGGATLAEIGRALYQAGIRNSKGNALAPMQVRRILQRLE